MLCRQTDKEIVSFLGESAVPTLFHYAGIPWVIDALLDSELYEEVQRVIALFLQQVERSQRTLCFLVDGRDGQGC